MTSGASQAPPASGAAGPPPQATGPTAQEAGPAPKVDPSQEWMTKLLSDMEWRYHERMDAIDGTVKGSEKRLGERLNEVETGLSDRLGAVESGFDDVTSEVRGLKQRVEKNERDLDDKNDRALERKIRGASANLPAGVRPRDFLVAPPPRVKPSSEDR